jgi:transaldolase
LIFTQRQYEAARDAIWRGAQRRDSLEHFKSVYSIFISRVDVYTAKHIPELSDAAQGQVGIVNAKTMWRANRQFWQDKGCPLAQEIVFASTGVKTKTDPAWKYVEALAGGDIQTNPPETNEAAQKSGKSFSSRLEELPPQAVLEEIASKVDQQKMEDVLMSEGIAKFAQPQKGLLALIAERRAELARSR